MSVSTSRRPSTLEFRMLGPVELHAGDRPCQLGSPKERALLASLLISPNAVVTHEQLTEDLWGSRPPASSAANVRTYVSRLRRRLPADQRHRLTSRPMGYVLAVGAQELDVARYDRLATDGSKALDRGDAVEAAKLLGCADRLWRGRPAEGSDTGWRLARFAAALQERHLCTVEDLLEARLAIEPPAALLPALRARVDEHPFRERGWRLLILALHGTGDRRAVVTTYAQARRTLLRELGVEPGADLRELYGALLAAEVPSRRPVGRT